MSEAIEFGSVDRITVGTVGPPGQRVFYLQAASGAAVVTVKLEKQQVQAMVDYLTKMVSDLPAPDRALDNLDLIEPVEQQWVVGSMAVTPYDDLSDSVVLVVEEATPPDQEDGASARFRVDRNQIYGLIQKGTELLERGRPPCPLCGGPLDPEGHVCPRSNGHARR